MLSQLFTFPTLNTPPPRSHGCLFGVGHRSGTFDEPDAVIMTMVLLN